MADKMEQRLEQTQTLRAEYEALQVAHRQLQHTDQLRQELVGMLVHDLKVPLAIILACLDLLSIELDGQLSAALRETLDTATQSGQRMLQLVTNLLQMQRLEAGQMPLHLQPVDLASLLRRMTAQVACLAQQKGVALLLHAPEKLPWIWADADLTERIVLNLLDNAIRLTPSRTEVLISSQKQGRQVLTSVSDQGPGIPPEQQAGLFDRFFQVESGHNHRSASVGLGLAFCKLSVEAQRGRIWVSSTPGQGTCFSFTLPIWNQSL